MHMSPEQQSKSTEQLLIVKSQVDADMRRLEADVKEAYTKGDRTKGDAMIAEATSTLLSMRHLINREISMGSQKILEDKEVVKSALKSVMQLKAALTKDTVADLKDGKEGAAKAAQKTLNISEDGMKGLEKEGLTQEQIQVLVAFIEKSAELLLTPQYFNTKNLLLMARFYIKILRNPLYIKLNKGEDPTKTAFEDQYCDYISEPTTAMFGELLYQSIVGAAHDNANKFLEQPIGSIVARFRYLNNRVSQQKYGTTLIPDDERQKERVFAGASGKKGHVADLSKGPLGQYEARSEEDRVSYDRQSFEKTKSVIAERLKTSCKNLGIDNEGVTIDVTLPTGQVVKKFDEVHTNATSYEYYAITDNLDFPAIPATATTPAIPRSPGSSRPIHERLTQVKNAINARETVLLSTPGISKGDRDRYIAEATTLKSSVRTYDFVCSLESSEEFEKNYRKYYQYHLSLIPAGVPEREKKAAIAVAHEFRDAIHFLNNNILFGQVVNQSGDPIIEFQTAATQGNPYVNPFTMYSKIANALTQIKTNPISSAINGTGTAATEPNQFARSRLGGSQWVETSDGRERLVHTTEEDFKIDDSMSGFLEELEVYMKSEKDLLEGGYNFRYVINTGAQGKSRGVMDTIAAMTDQTMTAEVIDRLYASENRKELVMIQSAAQQLMISTLGEGLWKNDERLRELKFNSTSGIQSKLKEYIDATFRDIPAPRRQTLLQQSLNIMYATQFRYHLLMSYTTPPQTFAGVGYDPTMRNMVFDPYYSWRRFALSSDKFDHDGFMKGTYFLPKNKEALNARLKQIGLDEHYDFEEIFQEGGRAYQNSQDIGHLAYLLSKYHVTKDGKVNNSWVGGPINEFKQGGIHEMRGWRFVWGIKANLPKRYVEEDSNGKNYSIKTDSPDAYTNVWKSIENVGANEIEGAIESWFTPEYAKKKQNEPAKVPSHAEEACYKDLTKHLFERYFKTGSGFGEAYGYGRHANADAFYKEEIEDKVKSMLKNGEHDKINKKIFKPILYQALSTIVFERSPLEYLYRIRGQDEQNGTMLVKQIRDKFKASAAFGMVGTAPPALSAEAWTKRWDETTGDLTFVQARMRKLVDQDIETNRSAWKASDTDHPSNIYGDKAAARSAVNGGKGYVIDADEIKMILIHKETGLKIDTTAERGAALTAYNTADPVIKAKIDRALLLHREIKESMMRAPAESETDHLLDELSTEVRSHGKLDAHLFEHEGRFEKLEKLMQNPHGHLDENRQLDLVDAWAQAKRNRVNRAKWFTEKVVEGYHGHISFMADHSPLYITYTNTDRRVVARAASDCFDGAENLKTYRGDPFREGSFLEMLKDAVRKGDETWGSLKSFITKNRKTYVNSIGNPDIFMPVIKDDLRIMLYALSQKGAVRTLSPIDKWSSWLDPKGHSIAAEAWTWWEGHDFNALEIRKFLIVFGKSNGFRPNQIQEFLKEFRATWADVLKEHAVEWGSYLLIYSIATWSSKILKKLEGGGSHH